MGPEAGSVSVRKCNIVEGPSGITNFALQRRTGPELTQTLSSKFNLTFCLSYGHIKLDSDITLHGK